MDFKIVFVVMNVVLCTNAFTICDCNAAHTKVIIDMSVPDYYDLLFCYDGLNRKSA